MTEWMWLDTTVPTIYKPPLEHTTVPDDFTWIGDKFGGSRLFAVYGGVPNFRQFDVSQNTVIRGPTLVGLAAADTEVELVGRGVTNDRKRLIFMIRTGAAAPRGDHWVFNDMDGNFIREVFPSTGLQTEYNQLVWMQNRLWILRHDPDTTWFADCFDPDTGDLVDSMALGATKLSYVGITTDGRNLWMVRDDVDDHVGGTIEEWDPDAKVMVRQFGQPLPLTDRFSDGITFADRFFLIYSFGALPGDGE